MAKHGIEYTPDARDPRRVRLYDGLPQGISRAEVTFRVDGGFRGSRVVPASAAETERRVARIDLDCPWCERPRRYLGQIGFLTGHTGFMSEAPSELGRLVDQQHAYRCDDCGSLLYFADGFLPHPLPGRRKR
ncbi:hypothetical protein [Nocardia sp. NPDC057227]|uniref:hypothetical protein n=1 Tax=Nocardia sp. NPDC057227 TaxID=3346056 RepID=UPI00363F9FAB